MRVRTNLVYGFLLSVTPTLALSAERYHALQDVIVTAQKRVQSLQDTPIAISVLDETALQAQGVYSLEALSYGTVPSLRIQPFTDNPMTLIVAIRGNGPADAGPVTREPNVAVYLDGIYIGRPQGLSLEVADLERIEVLRGPQGTLFGRNATSGAVSLITKKPTGKFGFEQTVGVGNYNAWRTVTRVDMPEVAGISAKFDYIHSEREGWVDNTAPGEWDYNAYIKDGGRLALRYTGIETLTIDYTYDRSKIRASQGYIQFYTDDLNLFGPERDRRSTTRLPVIPLDPSVSRPEGHALSVAWDISDSLSMKSLTGYREVDDSTRNNYGPAIYYNGLISAADTKQRQFSQEFQLIGQTPSVEWIAGLYYFNEDVHQDDQKYFSLDMFGMVNGVPMTPIIPPTVRDPVSGFDVPLTVIDADSTTKAIFGQATYTPPSADRFHFTLGARYTDDEKRGSKKVLGNAEHFTLDTSNVDGTLSVTFDLDEDISTYLKWSSGYQAGGISPRSRDFVPYDEVTVKAWEFGIKSEFIDNRLRINADIFETKIDNLPIDVSDPNDIVVTQTINNQSEVTIKGLEVDANYMPIDGLIFGLSYTYLDGDMGPTRNPLAAGQLEQFELTQTPRHAGAVSVSYNWKPTRFGAWSAYLDVTSTDKYAYVAIGRERFDSYTLVNARLTLSQIPLGQGELQFDLWGKNILDEEYIVSAFPIGSPVISIVQQFGDPRTYGLDVKVKF